MTTIKMIRPPTTMSTSTLNDDFNVNTCTAKSPTCSQSAGNCESDKKSFPQKGQLNYHLVDCPLCKSMIQVADHLSIPNESRFKSDTRTADGLRERYSKVLARTHCSKYCHAYFFEVADRNDYITRDTFARNPDRNGASFLLTSFICSKDMPTLSTVSALKRSHNWDSYTTLISVLKGLFAAVNSAGLRFLNNTLRAETFPRYIPVIDKTLEGIRRATWISKVATFFDKVIKAVEAQRDTTPSHLCPDVLQKKIKECIRNEILTAENDERTNDTTFMSVPFALRLYAYYQINNNGTQQVS